MVDGRGYGVAISGEGLYTFENLSVESEVYSSGYSLYIGSKTDVAVNGLFISTVHTSYRIYSAWSGHLSFANMEIRPLNRYQQGIYVYSAKAIEIDNLTFITMTTAQYYTSIYFLQIQSHASITNSYIDCNKLQFTNGIEVLYSSNADIEVKNVTLFSGDASSQHAHSLLRIHSGRNVALRNNTVVGGNLSDGYGTVVVQHVEHFLAANNVVTNTTARGHLWDVSAYGSIVLQGNIFDDCKVGGQQDYAFLSVNAPSLLIQENTLNDLEGNSLVKLGVSIVELTFTRNIVVNPVSTFYIETTSLYDAATGNDVTIGPNYWNTTSFSELDLGAYDSTYNSDLVTIAFESLFVDRDMTQLILAPPSQAILDEAENTISGTISDAILIVVPSGLYYAPGSIILRHPNAELVLEAGVSIEFAPHASIRVDQGTLRVLGENGAPVLLAPVSADTETTAVWVR